MASSGTDDEDTAEFLFYDDGEEPDHEARPDPLGFPPETIVRAGRRFFLRRWELRTQNGGRARPRFIYSRFRRRASEG